MRKVELGNHTAEDLKELISLFHGGADPAQLRVLLRHAEAGVVVDGAYILSELGPMGAPFVGDAVRLLDCPNSWVRFHAIDSLLACVDESDPAAVMACLLRLADADDNVRYKAREFSARASLAAVQAGLRAMAAAPAADGGALHQALAKASRVGGIVEEATRSADPRARAEAMATAAIIFRCDSEAAREVAAADGELGELARQCLRVRRRQP